jgi:hypothetical protein
LFPFFKLFVALLTLPIPYKKLKCFRQLKKTIFSIVVVSKKRLYTTTTSGLCSRLLFGFSVWFKLQTACAASHNHPLQRIGLAALNDN